jgi:hypothetical protein
MKFNPSTGELTTDSGFPIKKLHCPLEKRWNEMEPIADRKRLCSGCRKHVHDINGLDDDQVWQFVRRNEEACLSLRLDSPNLTIEGTTLLRGLATLDESCPLRRIRTARGAREINELASPALRPLIVEARQSAGTQFIIWQHEATGRIAISGHERFPPEEVEQENRRNWKDAPWLIVGQQLQEEPRRCGEDGLPIAAYMIPQDLRLGERVWIEDIIESVVRAYGGKRPRIQEAGVAIWEGDSFRFNESERVEVVG